MKFNETYLVSHKRTHLSEFELAKLKRHPDYTFPEDLSDFLLKFGPGEYCGCYYIFQPEDLLNGQAACREVCIVHPEALALVSETLGVEHLDVDQAQDFSIFFCPKISGYAHVYTNNLDIHHDLDFDSEVCRTVEEKYYRLGFRLVEHYRP